MKKPNKLLGLGWYRLTLSHQALTFAMRESSPIAGQCHVRRPDGQWDCFVTLAVADTLKQMANPGENLSDAVVRLLALKESTNG